MATAKKKQEGFGGGPGGLGANLFSGSKDDGGCSGGEDSGGEDDMGFQDLPSFD